MPPRRRPLEPARTPSRPFREKNRVENEIKIEWCPTKRCQKENCARPTCLLFIPFPPKKQKGRQKLSWWPAASGCASSRACLHRLSFDPITLEGAVASGGGQYDGGRTPRVAGWPETGIKRGDHGRVPCRGLCHHTRSLGRGTAHQPRATAQSACGL